MRTPLRNTRRALWSAIPRNDRPTWTEFNNKEMWKK